MAIKLLGIFMFYVTYVFEILALLTGLIFFSKIKPVVYRLIVPILLLTVVNEGFTHYGVYKSWNQPKILFYTIFFILQIIVFSIIYYFSYNRRRYRNIVAVICILSVIAGIVFLKIYGIFNFNPYFINAIAIGLVLMASLYLYSIQANDKVYHLAKDSLFWFSVGLITVNFFLLLFVNALFIDSFKNDKHSQEIFSTLNSIGNVIYYSCIIISILCSSQSPRRAGT